MSNIERYEQILIAAIEIQQLKSEIKDRLRVLSQNMTAYELKNRSFENEDASKAFSIVLAKNDFIVMPESHVQSSLKYKDVKIYLHCQPAKLGSQAMGRIIDAIKNTEILDA
jgi:hypothetical protein